MTQNIEERTEAAVSKYEGAAGKLEQFAETDSDVSTGSGSRKSFPKLSREIEGYALESLRLGVANRQGVYAVGVTYDDPNWTYTYNGQQWGLSANFDLLLLPYETTQADPSDDDNLSVHGSVSTGHVNQAQGEAVGGSIFPESGVLANGMLVGEGTTHLRVLIDGKPKIVEMSPIASGIVSLLTQSGAMIGGTPVTYLGYRSFKDVNDMLNSSGLIVGFEYHTGSTKWRMVTKSSPVVLSDFEPSTPVYVADFTKFQSDSQAFYDAVQIAAEKGKPCYINTKLEMTEKVTFTSPLVYKLYMHQGELFTTEDNFDFAEFEVTVDRLIIRDVLINGNNVAQRGIKVKCSCDIFGGEIKDFDSRLGDATVSAYGINLEVPASKQVEMNVVNVDIKKILTRKDGSVGQSAGSSRAIYASTTEQITGNWVSRVNIIDCGMSDIFGREGDILHIQNIQTVPDKVIFKVEDNRLIRSNRRNMKLLGHNIVLARNYLETIDRNSDWYGLDGEGGAGVITFSSSVFGEYVEGCKMFDTEIVNKGGVKSHTLITNTKGFQAVRTTASLRGDTTSGISPFDILNGNEDVLFKDSEIEMSTPARISSSLTGDNKVKNINFYGKATNLRSWCEPSTLDINLTVDNCEFSFPLSSSFLSVWLPNAGSVNHYVGLVTLIRNKVYAPASGYGDVVFLNDKEVDNLVCLDNVKKRAGNPFSTNAGTVIGSGCVFRRNDSLTVEDQRPI